MTINTNTQQEHEPSIRRVSVLLKRIKVPGKTEAQWSALESSLFGRIAAAPEQEHGWNIFSSVLRPMAFASGLAAIALAAFGVSWSIKTPDNAVDPCARLLSVHGQVLVGATDKKCTDTLKGINGGHGVFRFKKGLCVATLDNSTFIMRLDKGSAMEVSPHSQLTFVAIDKKQITINLTRGSILAKVSKRSADQKFSVITPGASCVVVGTIFRVDVCAAEADSALNTVLTVYEGKVRFVENSSVSKQPRHVATGQRCMAARLMGPLCTITEAETPFKEISTLELLVGPDSTPPEISGLIDISSQPDGATVILDNAVVGKTPLLLRKPIGNHSITVAAAGYAPSEQTIRMERDSTSGVTARLIKKPETLQANRAQASAPRIALLPIPAESTLLVIPEYVEAMIQSTIGEYQKSLSILEALKNNAPIDIKSAMTLMRKINGCYAKLGDFSKALENLRVKCAAASSVDEKENALWEIANVSANCMGDYPGAQQALTQLLGMSPTGKRTADAYKKLAEVRYMQGNFKGAALSYSQLLQKFPDDPDRDRTLFNLASITKEDTRDFKEALRLYSQIIDAYPRGAYYKAAFFKRAECLAAVGRIMEARCDYKKYLTADPQGIWSSACAERLQVFK